MRRFEPAKAGDRLNMQVVRAGTGQAETTKEGKEERKERKHEHTE